MGAGRLWKAGVVLLTAGLPLLAVTLPANLSAPPISLVQTPDGQLQVGQPFPELRLPLLNSGEPGTVSAFRGKKIILHLFASW